MVLEQTFIGLNNVDPPSLLKPGEFTRLENVEFDSQSKLQTRPGLEELAKNANLIPNTRDMSTWTIANNATFVNGLLDPQGNTHAFSITDTSAIATSAMFITAETPLSGALYSTSVWVKTPTTNAIKLFFQFIGSVNEFCSIDFGKLAGATPGFFGSSFPANSSLRYGILESSGDWYRIFVEMANATPANTEIRVWLYPSFKTITEVNGATVIGNLDLTLQGTETFWKPNCRLGKMPSYSDFTIPYDPAFPNTVANNVIRDDIRSVYEFKQDDGSETILCTAGSKAYRLDSTNSRWILNSGAVTLPSDKLTQWVMYDNAAYMINGGGVGFSNPCKITTTTGNLANVSTIPESKYGVIFNDRLWVVKEAEPNVLLCSALGNPEDFTTTGVAGTASFIVGAQEGSLITGLIAFNGSLYVFKKNKIYALLPGSPNTDIEQYDIELITDDIGCIAVESVRGVLNDIIFLSEYGLVSLSAVLQKAPDNVLNISRNLKEFQNLSLLDSDRVYSISASSTNQYILSIPVGGVLKNSKTFVFDFSDISLGYKITEWSGGMVAPAFGKKDNVLLVGSFRDLSNENIAGVFFQADNKVSDNDINFTQTIETRGLPGREESWVNHKFHRIIYQLELINDNGLTFTHQYKINEDNGKKITSTINIPGTVTSGAVWGNAVWGTSFWGTQSTSVKIQKIRTVRFSFGRFIQGLIQVSGAQFKFLGLSLDNSPGSQQRI